MSSLYRATPVGAALTESLNQMISEGSLTHRQAAKILEIFEEVFSEESKRTIVEKQVISSDLHGTVENFNCLGDQWRIDASDVDVLLGSVMMKIKSARILFS